MVKDKTLPCGGNSLSDIYFLLNASVSLFDWRKDKFPSPLSQGLLYSIEPLAEGSEGLIIQTATANQSPSAKPDPLLPGHSSLQVCPQGNEFEGTLFFFFPNSITQSGGVKGLMLHDKGQPSLGGGGEREALWPQTAAPCDQNATWEM